MCIHLRDNEYEGYHYNDDHHKDKDRVSPRHHHNLFDNRILNACCVDPRRVLNSSRNGRFRFLTAYADPEPPGGRKNGGITGMIGVYPEVIRVGGSGGVVVLPN